VWAIIQPTPATRQTSASATSVLNHEAGSFVVVGGLAVRRVIGGNSRQGLLRWLAILAILAGATALGASSCANSGKKQSEKSELVRGHLIEVEAASIVEVASLAIRDEDGTTWSFDAMRYRGVTPSHLRDHMLRGLPITVVFHVENDVRLIDEITD